MKSCCILGIPINAILSQRNFNQKKLAVQDESWRSSPHPPKQHSYGKIILGKNHFQLGSLGKKFLGFSAAATGAWTAFPGRGLSLRVSSVTRRSVLGRQSLSGGFAEHWGWEDEWESTGGRWKWGGVYQEWSLSQPWMQQHLPLSLWRKPEAVGALSLGWLK